MEPNEVLHQFMDLCNNPSGFSQFNLAPNTVLEWFGSTIRGGHKIYQYYRYDLCHQYEHHFVNAKQCDPIESKPSHSQTKQLPITDCNQLECGIVKKDEKDDSIVELTTPTRLHETPKLPSLTQGRSFLLTNSDDLEDLGLSKIDEAITPPPKTSFPSNFGEPLPKKLKVNNDSGCEDVDNVDDTRESIVKNSEKFINSCETHNNTGKKDHNYTTSVSDTSTKNNNDAINQQCSSISNKFSDLMYIETIGSLRARNKTKHRGITGMQQLSLIEGQTSCSTSLESPQSYWDRETKIRISYRIRFEDQQIQFFLILYEHLTKKNSTRRNLLLEFQDNNDDVKTPSAKKPEPPEIKRKTPFKKNMRLF